MKKVNQKSTTVTATGEVAATGNDNVVSIGTPVVPVNVLQMRREQQSERLASKAIIMQKARQELAQAHDLYMNGEGDQAAAEALSAIATDRLYQGLIGATLTLPEVSGALGDVFGYNPKQDGTPGKTPSGAGSAIRKRLVRSVQARDYVSGGDGGRFFDGLPEDVISDVVEALDSGSITVWTAYQTFADIKKELSERAQLAFDPKRIVAIAASLREEGAASTLASSEALQDAYAMLADAINDCANLAGEIAANAA